MPANPRIMIVDDEFLNAMALGDFLQENGFEIVGPFTTTQAALQADEIARTDAAFLDINLGEGETSEQIAQELSRRGIPYVFLTGYSEIPPEMQAFENAAFIGKPVTFERALNEAREMSE